jgi:hypothetical protein
MPASRVSPQDPAAALAFAVVAILGAFGLAERWGITADMVMTIIGSAMTVAATVRAWRDARRPPVVGVIVGTPELAPAVLATVEPAAPKGSTEATTRRIEGAVDG